MTATLRIMSRIILDGDNEWDIKRMVTMHVNRSWDAVKGVALDQTTDHADYVQVG